MGAAWWQVPPAMGVGSELDVELFDLVGLGSGRVGPFEHRRHGQDRVAVARAVVVERDVVGEKRAQTGAYIASAIVGAGAEEVRAAVRGEAVAPDRAMRSMSACAPLTTRKPGWCALRFIGSAERRFAKPECISPQIERQCARAAGRRAAAPRRADLVQVLGDRERVPDRDAAVVEARHEERGREEQQLGPRRRLVGRRQDAARRPSRPANRHSRNPRSDHEP